METRSLKLPGVFIKMLMNLPETGMGYQLVKIILRNGKILHQHKVINAEMLLLEENDDFSEKDILKIELESRNK